MATPNLGLKNDYTPTEILGSGWVNAVADGVDKSLRAGYLPTSVAGSGDITLSVAQYDATLLEFTGALVGARNVILPLSSPAGRAWWIYNNTTGAYALTVKGATGSGVVVAQSKRALVITDGTDFYAATTDAAVLGAAPNTPQYLALATDSGLTNERVFTPGSGLSAVDSGAGLAYTLSIANGGVTAAMLASGAAPSTVPQWQKFTVGYAALSTGATTNDIQLYSLPAGGVIHAVKIKHSTSFTGGAISAYTLSVGITGTLAKYASAFNVFQAPGNTVFQLTNVVGSENHGAATSIRLAATSTSANLSAATAGSVDIWLLVSVAA